MLERQLEQASRLTLTDAATSRASGSRGRRPLCPESYSPSASPTGERPCPDISPPRSQPCHKASPRRSDNGSSTRWERSTGAIASGSPGRSDRNARGSTQPLGRPPCAGTASAPAHTVTMTLCGGRRPTEAGVLGRARRPREPARAPAVRPNDAARLLAHEGAVVLALPRPHDVPHGRREQREASDLCLSVTRPSEHALFFLPCRSIQPAATSRLPVSASSHARRQSRAYMVAGLLPEQQSRVLVPRWSQAYRGARPSRRRQCHRVTCSVVPAASTLVRVVSCARKPRDQSGHLGCLRYQLGRKRPRLGGGLGVFGAGRANARSHGTRRQASAFRPRFSRVPRGVSASAGG
jgi:hypothetical protein